MKPNKTEFFPDGTPIDKWFYNADIPELRELGKKYVITEYGIYDDGKIYTRQFQGLIDLVSENGGGVIVVPKGTYYSGALFFKQGVNLYVEEDGTLKGSDDISDYPVMKTRIECECCMYFPALINADGVEGLKICGKGVIDGNGLRSWVAFWKRREWNPNCTNKDEQRARLIFLSHCSDVVIAGLRLQNSQFWTSHIYKCSRVKYINCSFFSPKEPVPSPSTDAIDIDVCSDVLIKNCYMEVNDDAVALKGGKGPWADKNPDNGINQRVLIEDCEYGFCQSGITCGSESVHNRNILIRRIRVDNLEQLIHFKLRPDTPQRYEYITVQDVKGKIQFSFINIEPWTQFFDLKGRSDKPVSVVEHINVNSCECSCNNFLNADSGNGDNKFNDFVFKDLKITARKNGYKDGVINNLNMENAVINIKK